MVYDWTPHEEVCRRLYIEEKRSVDDIIMYMQLRYNFTPSKRAFQTQFKKWDFPSRQNPAYKNQALVDRIRELWESNVSQKDMLRILQDEGFEVSMRELMRVRNKNRWLLREPQDSIAKKILPTKLYEQEQSANQDEYDEEDDGVGGDDSSSVGETTQDGSATLAVELELDTEEQKRREYRRQVLAADSAEKWATKKRRRRTREWAGMPADPPGPPRFPSETTLEESKTILNLDTALYKDFRQKFQRICEEAGIIKKTIAGPAKWEAAKEQLIRESTNLRSLMWDKDGMEHKKLAIDLICCDITKRMRSMETQINLPDAKNILGLNPQEARETRFAFYRILEDDNFVGKQMAGDEHWRELKQKWVTESDLLQRVLNSRDGRTTSATHARLIRAIDVLARDVMKRHRDAKTGRHAKAKRPASNPEIEATPDAQLMDDLAFADNQTDLSSPAARKRRAQQQRTKHPLEIIAPHVQSRLLPPELLAPAADPGFTPEMAMLLAASGEAGFVDQQSQAFEAPQFGAAAAAPPSAAVAVYFRLHALSAVGPAAPAMWISTLATRSVADLRSTAAAKVPGAICLAVDGLVKDGKGGEAPLQILGDAELDAYLDHVQSMQGGAPTFSVQLVRGWNTG